MAEGEAALCVSGLLWLRHGSKPWRSSALYFVCDGAKLSYFTQPIDLLKSRTALCAIWTQRTP